MKRILRNIVGILVMTLAFSACSSTDFEGANQSGIPSVSDVQYTVTVDQKTNIVTFKFNTPGLYPIWEVEGSPVVKTTNTEFTKKYIFKGTYNYTLKVGNRNGVSDGEMKGTFTVENTRYDFSKTIAALTGGSSKEWRIYSSKVAHIACGPVGTDGTDWWSAKPNEKADEGIYDDRMTFSNTDDYVYSAGTDGRTFVNKGVTKLGVTGAANDYNVTAIGQFGTQDKVKYALGYDDVTKVETITLPAKTLFPYMGHDSQFEGNYTLRILSIEDKYMTLALDLPGIVWHFELIHGDDPAPSSDFSPEAVRWTDANHALNLAKGLNEVGNMVFWWADANWSQIADPTFVYDKGVYTITSNAATAERWQGQCSIHNGNVSLEAGQAYDISVTINVNEPFAGACIKICDESDNPVLVIADPVSLKRGDNVLRWAKRYSKIDGDKADAQSGNVKFIIDLGGCPAGLVTKVSNIIIQKHNPK